MANAPVQFGLALPMVLANSSARRTVAELTSEVLAAEASGFDLCLVPEHHGGPDTTLTDPMVTVAWLLARTSRIKVGTGVLILPLHSLPRLAEQACFLQHASQGRLVIGIGAGYQTADFATFDVPLSSRRQAMSDGIRALREVWVSGELGGHPIRPLLDGAPAPPLYVGAWTAPGIDQAAVLADGWIADPIRSADDTAEAAARYLRSTLAAGRTARILIMREAWLAVSALGDDTERHQVVEALTHAEGFLRAQLGRRLENLRSVPRLHFELDESIAYSVRVSTLLRDLEAERPVEAAVEVPE